MTLRKHRVCIIFYDGSPGRMDGQSVGRAQQSEYTHEQSTRPTGANSAALRPDRA